MRRHNSLIPVMVIVMIMIVNKTTFQQLGCRRIEGLPGYSSAATKVRSNTMVSMWGLSNYILVSFSEYRL